MWKTTLAAAAREAAALHPWRMLASRPSTSSASSAVDSILLRSLKEHYLEVSKMSPPPKINPPSPFSVVKGALDSNGPVLRRSYGDEEISISVMRLANIIPGGGEDEDDGDGINQLFLHVDVSKPGEDDLRLHFLCGLYPDAIGIHSVSLRPKINGDSSQFVPPPTKYHGPGFEDLDEKMRDALHSFIEERGVDENLFAFLQAWLYVKDHRNLMRWFKSIGTFINERKST
ncbi:hypothetical protein MRB53_002625 [Persea americana]|uniref:Uncharacterized protein n=1 Tax=Persea americana TaxID=3435 RepID=A0ACC2MUW9_PERAE|nr:hypothetical protein MRB53_002625 [Persea americana]